MSDSPTTVSAAVSLSADLKVEARRLGFDLVGIAPAVTPTGLNRFHEWLQRGYAGEMSYLPRRQPAYEHPGHVMERVRSVIMLGMNYKTRPALRIQDSAHRNQDSAGEGTVSGQPSAISQIGEDEKRELRSGSPLSTFRSPPFSQSSTLNPQLSGPRVAQYAQGSVDYHDLLRERLKQLADFLHRHVPGCRTRGVVDTAPLLERDFARLAGLGWFGKNTMLINKQAGSYLFLAGLLTDVELEYDQPHETSHCGTCTRCLDACPTDAFPEPGVLDARRCISYLTIELRGPIPAELREGMGNWLFGCDVCQEVCPWNRKAPVTAEPAFQPVADLSPADAAEILQLDETTFRERFRQTPLFRPGRAGLLRNAAIVLGNSGDRSVIPVLKHALHDAEPLIRGAAAWALGKLGGEAAVTALQSRQAVEDNAAVRTEIDAALRQLVRQVPHHLPNRD